MVDSDYFCKEHSDHRSRLKRNESDIQDLWKHREQDRQENVDSFRRLHERIDGMKNWVITGMASMSLYFAVAIVQFILNWIAKG